jgi:hypothetical protein
MNRAISLGALLFVLCPTGAILSAQPTEQERKVSIAAAIVGMTSNDAFVSDVLDQLAEKSIPMDQLAVVVGHAPTAEDVQKARQACRRSLDVALPQSEIHREIALIYAEEMSLDDLVALLDFYKSPLGQRLIGASFRIMNQAGTIVQGVMEKNTDRFQEVLLEELTKAFRPQ